MKKISFLVIILFIFSCTSKNDKCKLEYFNSALKFPDKFEVIDCSLETYDISVYIKFNKNDVPKIIEQNNFNSFKKPINITASEHHIFFNNLKEYFEFSIPNNIEITDTHFYINQDNKNNSLSCLINSNGDFWAVLEKGTLPPNW